MSGPRRTAREQLVEDLREADWPAVAEDVADGVPLSTVLSRLQQMQREGEEMIGAMTLVANAQAHTN